jgi:hypothetical protein
LEELVSEGEFAPASDLSVAEETLLDLEHSRTYEIADSGHNQIDGETVTAKERENVSGFYDRLTEAMDGQDGQDS